MRDGAHQDDPLRFEKRLLNDWHAKGIDTVEQAKKALSKPASATRPARRARPAYQQHDLSDDELNSLLVDLDQDL